MPPRILVAVHLDTFFTWLVEVAQLVRDTSTGEPLILFAQPYENLPRDKARCEQLGLAYVGQKPSASPQPTPALTQWQRLRRRLPRAFKTYVLSFLRRNLLFQLGRLAWRRFTLRRFIRRQRIDMIILGGDIAHYDTAVYIQAAHLEHIPAVVVAGWMIHQDENAEAFMFDPDIDATRGLNRWVSRRYPQWRYEYRGRTLLRLPGGQVLAREWLGLAPPRPWTLHSGYTDAICVESQAVYDACVREGLPPQQLRLVGSINHDAMAHRLHQAHNYREELYRSLGLPPERRLIVVAFPPNELLRIGGRPECDFTSYAALAQFWLSCLTALPGWNVVVSLHPAINPAELGHVEMPTLKIARHRTAELVPLCDLFVASVSTTIQWATACGKPIINYDVYRYRQNDYAHIPGILSMETQAEFRAALQKLTTDETYYQNLAQQQTRVAAHWGVLDGQAGTRLMQALNHFLQGASTQP